jgi:urease accessory protein
MTNNIYKLVQQAFIFLAIALLAPAAVLAHDGASLPYGSFLSGFTHPVLGVDHFLAMVSVGIVSAQLGGRAVWTVPCTFVLVMVFGGLLGWLYTDFSAVEVGIAISVLALGVAIAADKSLPISLVMTAVGFFAIFHGYAHGAEMPTVANPYTYAVGFMTGTAVLHIGGLVVGDIARHYQRGKLLLRLGGGAIAGVGAAFLTGVA